MYASDKEFVEMWYSVQHESLCFFNFYRSLSILISCSENVTRYSVVCMNWFKLHVIIQKGWNADSFSFDNSITPLMLYDISDSHLTLVCMMVISIFRTQVEDMIV